MSQQGWITAGLGGVVLLGSVALGGLSTGYSMGLAGFLLRIGTMYVLIGAVLTLVERETLSVATVVAVTALGGAFLVGAGAMYYDLVVTPPESGGAVTLVTVVIKQAQFASLFAPIAAATGCRMLWRRDRIAQGLAVFGGALFGGWFVGTLLVVAGGTQSEFASLYYFAVSLAAGVTSLPLLVTNLEIPLAGVPQLNSDTS